MPAPVIRTLPRPAAPVRRSSAHWLALLLVMALPIGALWPVCDHAFTSWDDHDTVEANPSLNPVALQSVRAWWTTPRMDLYVPMTYSVWGLIALVWGSAPSADAPGYLDPAAFHTANLILHVLACLVVFELLRLLIERAWPAAIGAMLFGVHPVQVEAVAWVSGMKDVLGGWLALLAIWQYLAAVKSGRRRWHFGIATIAFVLAMLAKPNELVSPIIAAVLDGMVLGRSWRAVLGWLWPWLGLSAACVAMGALVQPATGSPHNVGIVLRPLVAIASIGFYVSKLFWPTDLAVDYGLTPAVLVHSPWLMAGAAFIAVAAIGLWFARRRARALVAGAIVFVVALLPVLGFVTFDFQSFSNVADHYLYLPMFGIALMAAWLAARWSGRAMGIGAGIVIGWLGMASLLQTSYWQNTDRLFERTYEVNPDSAAATDAFALEAARSGSPEDALHWAEETIRLRPDSPLGYIADAMGQVRAGRLEFAADQYRKALQLDPSDVATRNDLATLLIRMNRIQEAESLARRDIALDPDFAGAHFNLGVVLFKRGDISGGIDELQSAVALVPWSTQFRLALGAMLEKAGRHREALEQLDAARRLKAARQ